MRIIFLATFIVSNSLPSYFLLFFNLFYRVQVLAWSYDADQACNFQPQICTAEDEFRLQMWRTFLILPKASCQIIEIGKNLNSLSNEEYIQMMRKAPRHVPCLLHEMELYRIDDCSEIGQLRKCLWEFTRIREWNKSPPKEFLEIVASATNKDYVVPSDAILRDLERFVGKWFLTKCLYKSFKKIRYCQNVCPDCQLN